MSKTHLKIGSVPYVNALPLVHHLKSDYIQAAPAKLTQMILDDTLDVALLPVYSILKHNLQAYPQAGLIGCDGTVKSVGFFVKSHIKSLDEIESLYLDVESRSSVHLAKIILKHFFKRNLKSIQSVSLEQCHLADAQVLIGNKALFFSEPGFQHFDIGEMWKQYTGHGFLFACWASKKPLPTSLIQELVTSKEKGLKYLPEIVAQQNLSQPDLVLDYLQNHIEFNLTDPIKKGFEKYAKFLREENFFENQEEMNTFFKHVQSFEQDSVFKGIQ